MSAVEKKHSVDGSAVDAEAEPALVPIELGDSDSSAMLAAMNDAAAKAGVKAYFDPLDIQTPKEENDWERVQRKVEALPKPTTEQEQEWQKRLRYFSEQQKTLQGRHISIPARPHLGNDGFYSFRTHEVFEFSVLDGGFHDNSHSIPKEEE